MEPVHPCSPTKSGSTSAGSSGAASYVGIFRNGNSNVNHNYQPPATRKYVPWEGKGGGQRKSFLWRGTLRTASQGFAALHAQKGAHPLFRQQRIVPNRVQRSIRGKKVLRGRGRGAYSTSAPGGHQGFACYVTHIHVKKEQ